MTSLIGELASPITDDVPIWIWIYYVYRTVASSLGVVRPYCIVIIITPICLVQVPHKCGTAMADLPYRI